MGEWEHISGSIYRRDILDIAPVLQAPQPDGSRVSICTGAKLSPLNGSTGIDLKWLKERWGMLLRHSPVLTIYWNDNVTPLKLEYDESLVTQEFIDEKFILCEAMEEDPFTWETESKGPKTRNNTCSLDVVPDKNRKGDYWIFIRGLHTLLDVTGNYILMDKLLSDKDLPPATPKDLPGSISSYGVRDRPTTYRTPGQPCYLYPDLTSPSTANYVHEFTKEESDKIISTIKSNGVTVGMTILGTVLFTMHMFTEESAYVKDQYNGEGDEHLPGILIQDLGRYAPSEAVQTGLGFLTSAPVCPTRSSMDQLLGLYREKKITPKDLHGITKGCMETPEVDIGMRIFNEKVMLPIISLVGDLKMLKPKYKNGTMGVSDLCWCTPNHFNSISWNLHTFDGKMTINLYANNMKCHKDAWETWVDIVKMGTGLI